jgi:type VI secretion system secreted protein VgrG
MTYPEIFTKCMTVILREEGRYVWDKSDSGGETNYGITDGGDGTVDRKADIDGDGRGDVLIAKLTADEAVQAYFNRYWRKMNLEQLQDPNTILQVLDFGINAGPGTSIKLAQKIAGATQDGSLGPKTAASINGYPGNFLEDFKEGRRQHYRDQVTANIKNAKFLTGWMDRVDRVKL